MVPVACFCRPAYKRNMPVDVASSQHGATIIKPWGVHDDQKRPRTVFGVPRQLGRRLNNRHRRQDLHNGTQGYDMCCISGSPRLHLEVVSCILGVEVAASCRRFEGGVDFFFRPDLLLFGLVIFLPR
jgi:hypothetical protein